MSLATISAKSNKTLDNTEEYIAELQRFNMLAEISGYEELISISNWCQQNLSLFGENQSDSLQQFVETGECWTWMELIKLAITAPDEISTISELNIELSREEWLEPLSAEGLQTLLLFLHNPQDSTNNNFEEVTVSKNITETDNTVADTNHNTTKSISTTNEEISELSFKWDNDVHPELLEVYFEETNENITDISTYLKSIGTIETTKEQRQDARRTAHTIKGGSAVVGITALSTYAYQLEKILDYAINHTLPNESNDLLHTASTGVKTLYETIKERKTSPDDFSATLSKLTLCAETLEELNDEPLELNTPVLPDFITQQNATNSISTDEEVIEEVTEIEQQKVIVDIESIDANTIENDVEEVDIEAETEDVIEAQVNSETAITQNNEDTDETVLPILNQSDDLSDFTAELDDIVMTLITTEVQAEKKPFKLDAYIEELQRLDMLAEISGYPEIVTVSNWYQHNLKLIAKKGTKKLGKFISSGESWAWVELISASLADPDDISHLSELSTELTRVEWVDVLDIETLQALLLVLRGSDDIDVNSSDETKNTIQEIESEIVESLETEVIDTNIITWDDDVHPELLSVYLQETSEQITKIAALLHIISKGQADKEQQEHAARIAHTIKGASGVVGITEIVDFTHKLEDILDYAVNNEIPEETAELLAESSDCLESLFEAVQDKAAVPEDFEPVLTKLTAYAEIIENDITAIDNSSAELNMPELPDFITKSESNSVDKKDSNDNNTEIENTNEELVEDSEEQTIEEITTEESIEEVVQEIAEVAKVSENSNESSSNSNEKQTSTLKPKDTPITESHIRVPTALINKLLNLAGELVTTSSQVSDKVEKTLVTTDQIKEQDKRVHDMLNELSTTIYKQEKDQMTMLSSMQNKDFDTLEMDTYNELHSVAGLLTESILDSETIESTLKNQLNGIHDDLRLLDNLNKELSETILSSRMESLNTLIPRLERIVRQTCRKTKKEAELIVTGNNINIDTDILNGLVDPLLHLLRNAVDHGIETPKARKSKKKNQAGKIQLNFSRQGNFIHMELKDDGAGIDSEKIYQHAINKGLITPDQEFSNSEVLKLILEPGFSTQTDVTDISGRGVGMDVVNKGIEALKGSLTITSEMGKGSSFNVRIPLTLVTSSTLLVETAGNKVAIPTDSIEQLYYLTPEDVLSRKDKKFIRHEGKELAIESLAGILGWTANDVDFTKAQTLLLVKGSQQLHAIYIDQIIHSREVVIRSLAHFIDGTKGVIGACHLSDGEVAPVMNLPQLLSLNEQSSYIVKHLDESSTLVNTVDSTPQILVVDDSLSNRKALSLIIEKTEYDVITAVDGLDALNVMNEKHIDLVFTDLEMPRMTGLELTQAIRAWDENKEIPIVMVTSRSTNKHRELAKKAGVDDYLTKPVGTDTLLESIETWLKQTVDA
jgi:chemosensory pili system protein ChpA (sensor histidine kinase/response regulator)